jgi:fermentation-respiration switch protein FrsA (DUF1100 family)
VPDGVRRLLLALGALVGCGSSVIDAFVFLPDRQVPVTPPDLEERWLETRDGVRLHAWYAGPLHALATLVWSHGNAGNIAGRVDVLRALAARGLGVLAYDYRGYGRSTGRPSEAGVYRDAEAAFDAVVRAGTPPGRVVCFGESLGGAVSIELAIRRPCAAVAVVATFTRLRDVAWVHYGPLALLVGDRFDALARVGRLRVPFFGAHGQRDDIVPFALGQRLAAAAPDPKQFLALPGRGHNDVLGDPALLDALPGFARAAVGP